MMMMMMFSLCLSLRLSVCACSSAWHAALKMIKALSLEAEDVKIMIASMLLVVSRDVTKRKTYLHSSSVNINFTIRRITNANVITYSASRNLHYTGI